MARTAGALALAFVLAALVLAITRSFVLSLFYGVDGVSENEFCRTGS